MGLLEKEGAGMIDPSDTDTRENKVTNKSRIAQLITVHKLIRSLRDRQLFTHVFTIVALAHSLWGFKIVLPRVSSV
jgi:hypothetical protein